MVKVLIVDDEPVNVKLLEKMLRAEGYVNVYSVTDPREVKPLYESQPFDLILLDILMPEMNGSQVLSRIRELEKEKHIPEKLKVKIIMISGVSEKEMVLACLRDGCDDFLVKPLETQLLFNKIRNFELLPADH